MEIPTFRARVIAIVSSDIHKVTAAGAMHPIRSVFDDGQ